MNQVQQINYRIESQTIFELVRFIVNPKCDTGSRKMVTVSNKYDFFFPTKKCLILFLRGLIV